MATRGSLVATNCMTQAPIGDVLLRTAGGETKLQLQQENLYVRTINAFMSAIAGDGKPLSTGEDGVASLAIALAALESARTQFSREYRCLSPNLKLRLWANRSGLWL